MPDNTCVCCGRIIPEGGHICLACGDYDDQQTFRPSSRAYYPEPPKVTNGDRIRQMTDEELAVLLVKYQVRGAVQAYGIVDIERARSIEEDTINSVCGKKDIETTLNMLKQEVSEDDESGNDTDNNS